MKVAATALLLSAALGLAGCAQPGPGYSQVDTSNNQLISSNYQAAEGLIYQMQDHLPVGTGPMIVTTLVNIDDLEKSSTLGRVVSEQVAARFTRAGYKMMEIKFGNSLYIRKDQGEMMLTREVSELASNHNAKAVLVGTYGESRNYVFINLKVIQPSSNAVLAVQDYALPVTPSISSMLRNR